MHEVAGDLGEALGEVRTSNIVYPNTNALFAPPPTFFNLTLCFTFCFADRLIPPPVLLRLRG
jgi:hypothetical protein